MPGTPLELKDSVVRAGAGAGKTRGLVNKVVEVYQKHRQATGTAPRIVLTTFTRKATQELKERLIKHACEARDPELLQYVSDPSLLFISTIHGLLNTFLKQVGHLAGLDSGLQIINPGEAQHMSRVALRQVLVDQPEYLNWLELYGFDRVLNMCRLYDAQLRENGELSTASLEDLKALKEKEFSQLRESLGQLIEDIEGETSGKPAWDKYVAGLRAVLSGTGEFERKPNRNNKTMEFADLHDHCDEIVDGFKEEYRRPCWQEETWPEMVAAWEGFRDFADAFSKSLNELKMAQGRFEMADLELKTLEVLREKPFVAAVFSEGWDFWMIDEYQDTSPVQDALLDVLIGDKPQYIVGDPQQSIYLFRGADVGVFKTKEAKTKEKGGELFELMKNYRSNPELLLWINEFMATLSSAFHKMQPKEDPDPEAPGAVQLLKAVDQDAEAEAIAARVGELVKQGAPLDQICVLGRTHRNLMRISAKLKKYGYPTHVHSSQGFQTRREVLDAQALWKFLINPHDNFNLILLLRSPWFFCPDWLLADWMADRPQSLWRKISNADVAGDGADAVARLKAAQTLSAGKGIVRAFEDTLKASAYLDLALANDAAGRKESNLWKLILKARALEKEGGQSILDLLGDRTEDPLDSNEGDATSAQEPNSINLMTIHGSKGLEFDHILLPGAGESKLTARAVDLSATDGKLHFKVWINEAGEYVTTPLDHLAQRRRQGREVEEFDRSLYVALTRAKKTLTVSWSDPARESWAKRSAWFELEAGVHQGEGFRYEIRLAENLVPANFESSKAEFKAPRPPWSTEIQTKESTRTSVTALIEDKHKEKADARDLLQSWQSRLTGTRLHKIFEGLKYDPDSEIDPGDEQTAKALRYVLGLKTPPLKELILNGHPEWGFQVATSKGTVEGQIDLWSEHDGKLYVVDYKTGSPRYTEQAFRQLGLYAWALRKFGHSAPAELVVIYPLSGKTEVRKFSEESFADWELELGGTQA